MKRGKLIVLMSMVAVVLMIAPAFAQMMGNCGPNNPGGPTNPPGPNTTYDGWGCFPSGPHPPGSSNGPTNGWCGFYNNANFGSLGMVSTQSVVMHILFPSLAPNCPISQLVDWRSKPERVDHFNVNGQIDYRFILTYDASGNPTKVELFNATDALVVYTECAYNSSGQFVQTLNHEAMGTELSYTEFIYNASGRLVNVQTYVNGLPAYTLGCIYNRMGQITRVSQYNPAGALQMYTNNHYNSKRQLSRTVSYSAMRAVLESRTYAYNAAGQMQRVSDYDNRRALNGYSTYMRNTSGQPTNSYFYNATNTQTGGSICYFTHP